MLIDKIKNYKLILASQSPRRQYLLREAGFNFEVIVPQVNEIYPPTLACTNVAAYLAELKAAAFEKKINNNEIVITADTVVILNNKVLGKPNNNTDAIEMLQSLSGKAHEVITGVCILTTKQKKVFQAHSTVHFRELSLNEITWYVNNYKPMDKAGSYGAQEWIGYIGIEGIEGSYFNVMGLPIQMLYVELEKLIG